ncbi:MAG: N-methylhydantoinase [Actinomycetota bacterium]|nr:N-methylhydantoinase [Actinomycetota bacterium]
MPEPGAPPGGGRSPVRVGVDVGGTFTKAIAFDLGGGGVVARSMVPTTHDDPTGPAAGVVRVIADVAAQVGPERIELVTHSTTQAVNALLEGDVGVVGVLALGRRPDLRKARKRTQLDNLELTAGKRVPVAFELLDITTGLDEVALDAALDRLTAAGVRSICVAEAFAPDDGAAERAAVVRALDRGLPACGSAEMTALYGLELRTVTAALNSSILPVAMQTAEHVEKGVRAVGITAPVMVMRGDGGAIDASGFRREPARTLYSGPAASVAGVLRFTRIDEGVILEIGGTSTNVAAIRNGRPALTYVRVASHATAVRALDVRVVGVAGGSMLRARRGRLFGVGPRSAHIAGLPYACYLDPGELSEPTAELIAPKPGDPQEYVVVRCAGGRRVAVTNTCAAVALGVVQTGDHAGHGASPESARVALAAAGHLLGLDADEVARRMLVASAAAIGELVTAVCKEYKLTSPTVVAVGGGAGGVGRFVATTLGLECQVPDGAEVISSIGDALSFVRVERERSVVEPTLEDGEALAASAEEACLAAGATASSIEVRVDYDQQRATLRASATGAIGLTSGAMPGRAPLTDIQAAAVAGGYGFAAPTAAGHAWIAHRGGGASGGAETVLLLDRYGDVVARGEGGSLTGANLTVSGLEALLARVARRARSTDRDPGIWLVHGSRTVALTPGAAAGAVAAAPEHAAVVVTSG